jgi:hypothetical protein
MLYANKGFKVIEKEMSFGALRYVLLGEEGRGRTFVTIPVPDSVTEVKSGMNINLTIGITKSGKPRIDNRTEGDLYLLLDTYQGYTRRGSGFTHVLKENKENVQVMASGKGAEGDAGRIGTWDCRLVKVNTQPTLILLCMSGGNPLRIIYVKDGTVYSAVGVDGTKNMFDNLDMELNIFRKNVYTGQEEFDPKFFTFL